MLPALPMQMDALATLPGILMTLIVIAVVILVARVVLSVAWKIVLVAVLVAAALWIVGLLGPVSDMLGLTI